VTHDQIEAMTMASRIAVINKGVLQQLDTPQNLYDHPNNLFVAGFIGSPAMNFFPGTLRREDGKLFVDTGDFTLTIPANRAAPFEKVVGKDIIFGIRPENIHDSAFVPPNIDAEKVPVKVDVTELMGNEIFLYLVSGKNTFVSRVDPRSSLRVGQQADVAFDMDAVQIFDAATEEAIR
jgi:multiple sugar transport system ATP-binding protein